MSQRAVAKIIQVFDHLNQRHERLSRMIRGEEVADKNDKDKTSDGVDKKNGDKDGDDCKKGDSDESLDDDSGKDKSDKDVTKVEKEGQIT